MFRDLSVKSIVIPPASTGTTAISRAAVQAMSDFLGIRAMGHGLLGLEILSGLAAEVLVLMMHSGWRSDLGEGSDGAAAIWILYIKC